MGARLGKCWPAPGRDFIRSLARSTTTAGVRACVTLGFPNLSLAFYIFTTTTAQFAMEAIKKKMMAMKLEKENAVDL